MPTGPLRTKLNTVIAASSWIAARCIAILIPMLILLVALQPLLEAYAVLSHEAIVDTVWSTDIVPLLKERFPGTTPDQLREAHAYAYGGAIIQDLGYYPFGSKFFSDLTHYVRCGDFISAMLRGAQNLDEYAFALGSVSHYAADNEGHSLAVNRAVPLLYPHLKKKYGPIITYEDDPLAHVKTEFGFDVLEVAKGRYAPDDYRDFIGFEVAQSLLDRAFEETYGLELHTVLQNESKALNSYRHDVSKLIPKVTRIAWQVKKDEIQNDVPGITRERFLYNLSRASYEKRWGREYHRPGPGDQFVAFLFRLIPKIGPLRVLTFRTPTPETEKLFEASFNATVSRYRGQLRQLQTEQDKVTLTNDNLDVGKDTPEGTYYLNDTTYAELLHRLALKNFSGVTPALQADIEDFYTASNSPRTEKKKQKQWARTRLELSKMKAQSSITSSIGTIP